MGIMRRLMYRSYGGPETLFIAEVPEPEPGKGQVLIRQAATSVNGGDLQARSGQVRFRTAVPRGFPKGIGQDVVGTVAALGTGVEDLAVGDLVWGVSTGSDAAADLVVMDSDRVAHAPAGIDPVRLAALPVAGTTSLAALVRNGGISAGRRVLIRGVGSVGTTAVQVAIAYGSEVTALCSPLTIDGVKELGADHVLSYLDADPSRLGRFDLILDTVGRGWEPFREQLAPGGRMLTITVDPAHPMASPRPDPGLLGARLSPDQIPGGAAEARRPGHADPAGRARGPDAGDRLDLPARRCRGRPPARRGAGNPGQDHPPDLLSRARPSATGGCSSSPTDRD